MNFASQVESLEEVTVSEHVLDGAALLEIFKRHGLEGYWGKWVNGGR
jgi:hypothetical protein